MAAFVEFGLLISEMRNGLGKLQQDLTMLRLSMADRGEAVAEYAGNLAIRLDSRPDMSTRTINALKKAGVTTALQAYDLARRDELLSVHNLGPKGLSELTYLFDRFGAPPITSTA